MRALFLLIPLVILFALSMGASGIAPSFAAALGARLVSKRNAGILFTIFVIVGAVTLGKNVSLTLGKALLPRGEMSIVVILIALTSATATLFFSNYLRIPQSTSQATVASIAGVGLRLGQLKIHTLFCRIIPVWILLPAFSYLITFLIYRKIYPPTHSNLHIYEKINIHEKKLRVSTILVSCYVAFAIGSNNVANAVGPLFGSGVIGLLPGLILISPLFGLGAALMGGRTLQTAGKEIVPLGISSSSVVSFITASLLLSASLLGVPQSLVQLNIFSIFAVSCLKNGHRNSMEQHIIRKTALVWTIAPAGAVCISYGLAALCL